MTRQDCAILLAEGLYDTPYAKTSHGLVRGPSRYPIAVVVDSKAAGHDAGSRLDGQHRNIPIVASLEAARRAAPEANTLILGVATAGGVLPQTLLELLLDGLRAGLTVVNGLHQPLQEIPEVRAAVERHSGKVLDFRAPRPASELRFWTGEVLQLATPRVAVLGTDCAVGKRTTAQWLRHELSTRGISAELIYTGQTGWLQGHEFGFLFDATPNDFVSGELEGALLACARSVAPQVMLIEGQASLRNPSGPCGAELLLSAAASGVILQHAPARRFFEGMESLAYEIPSVASEVDLIRSYGCEVWAVTLHQEGLSEPESVRGALEDELGIPVLLPLDQGVKELGRIVCERAGLSGAATS